MVFRPVESPQDQERLAELAGSIWHEYWPALIGEAQTDYMVERFQSLPAIRRDIAESAYEYWLVCDGDRVVGYTVGRAEPETGRFFISKIYLKAQERGRGYARRVVEFYDALCRERGLHAMYLTVNKGNVLGVRAYKGTGFETVDAVETDIGHGFVMDDYIMERPVGR